MNWLANITGGYTSSAKVVDGALVLSLPDAVSPVVWRMELEDVKAAALGIEPKGEHFVLTMKEGKSEIKEIAPFDNKDKAVKALMAASNALENSQGAVRSNDNNVSSGKAKGNFLGQLMSAIVGLVILVVLLFALSRMGPEIRTTETIANGGPAAQSSSAAPAGSPGTPQSADDFLRGR